MLSVALFTVLLISAVDASSNCSLGYSGSLCNVTYCESSAPCLNGGTCFMANRPSIQPAYVCGCAPGFRGAQCQINDDDCLKISCGEHGKCVDGINSYSCECEPGYTGSACDVEINEVGRALHGSANISALLSPCRAAPTDAVRIS